MIFERFIFAAIIWDVRRSKYFSLIIKTSSLTSRKTYVFSYDRHQVDFSSSTAVINLIINRPTIAYKLDTYNQIWKITIRHFSYFSTEIRHILVSWAIECRSWSITKVAVLLKCSRTRDWWRSVPGCKLSWLQKFKFNSSRHWTEDSVLPAVKFCSDMNSSNWFDLK